MTATASKTSSSKSKTAKARRKPPTASKPASATQRSAKRAADRTDSKSTAAATKSAKTAPKATAKTAPRSKGAGDAASKKTTTAKAAATPSKPKSKAAAAPSTTAKPSKAAADTPKKAKAAAKAKVATKAPAKTKAAPKSPPPAKTARKSPPSTAARGAAAAAPAARVEADEASRAASKKKAAAGQATKAVTNVPATKPKPEPKPTRPVVRKRTLPRPEGFKNGNWVVHPSHGPGRVVGSEKQSLGGETLELITIAYGREMARLKIPITRLQELGLRPISSKSQIQAATNTLKKPARISRTMWSRRAQDYESKLHSGDLVQIAEVLRDLYRAPDGPEQSFSERELYKDALDRFSRELAAAEKNLTEEKAAQRLEGVLRRAT
ncbi:MAG: CarD family transcriptional regulator [Rhodospirillales bacterium]|nr:CarD family transcriptional regulator [Rhodospirillales bacterium]